MPPITGRQSSRGPDAATVQYGYTGCGCAGGQTVTVTDERGKKSKQLYDFYGRLSEAHELDGSSNTYSKAVYSYDAKRQQMTNLYVRRVSNTGSDNVIANSDYDYYNGGANNGRIQKINDNTDATYTTTYGYDAYNRLTSATATAYTRSYGYDNWGNLTGVTSTGGGLMSVDGLPATANYESASNRLTSIVPNASTGINPANPRTSIMTQQAIRRVSSKATASRNDTVTTQWEGWRRSKPTTTLHRQQRPK